MLHHGDNRWYMGHGMSGGNAECLDYDAPGEARTPTNWFEDGGSNRDLNQIKALQRPHTRDPYHIARYAAVGHRTSS